MSLIEVIVAMGVMGILSYAMIEMISNQNKAIKTTQYAMDMNEVQNQLQRYMLDSDICKSTLGSQTILPGQEKPITEIKKNNIAPAPPTVLLAVNQKIGGIEITGLKIKRSSTHPNDIDLTADLKKTLSGNSYAGDNFKKTIKLSAKFLPATPNLIDNCYSQMDEAVNTAVQQACLQLCPTCTWDSVNNVCVRPPAGANKPLYKNEVNGQLTTSSPPANFNTQYCFSEGSSHSYSHTCGVARSRAADRCTNAGAQAYSISSSHGGCGGGTKQSCTATATCTYIYTLQGYLTPNPN